jgi:hypothetical protein
MRKPARGFGPFGKSQIGRLLVASAGEGEPPPPPLSTPMTGLGETPSGGAHERRRDDEPRQGGGRGRSLGPLQDDLLAEDEDPDEAAGLGFSHGLRIALATFVPTFLAIVLGIPYLAGLPTASRFRAGLERNSPTAVSSLAPDGDIVGRARAPMTPPEMLTARVARPADEPARLPSTPMQEAVEAATSLATTPAIARPGLRDPQSQSHVAPKAAEPKRSESAVTKNAAWLRAAAFADRGAAERLAASIERQGYPTKIRRDGTPPAPWVVWIGKQPRELSPSERQK